MNHGHPKTRDQTNIMVGAVILTKIPSKGIKPIDVTITQMNMSMQGQGLCLAKGKLLHVEVIIFMGKMPQDTGMRDTILHLTGGQNHQPTGVTHSRIPTTMVV